MHVKYVLFFCQNKQIFFWSFETQVDGYRRNWKSLTGSSFYLVLLMEQPLSTLMPLNEIDSDNNIEV